MRFLGSGSEFHAVTVLCLPLCRCAGGVKKAIVDNSAEGVIGPLNCVNYSGRAGVKKEAPNTQYGC